MINEQLIPARLAEPPPQFQLDLLDGDRVVGWINQHTIAFHGFADETEGGYAAWAAHRTLSWRLAVRAGRRRPPIDVEPLTLVRHDGDLFVHASAGRFARLLAPSEHRSSWAFELTLPKPLAEVFVRAKAYAIYRMLRRSGIRWKMWTARRPPKATRPVITAEERSSFWTRFVPWLPAFRP
jgi:hypothetical protein